MKCDKRLVIQPQVFTSRSRITTKIHKRGLEALNNAQQLAKTVTFEFQFHQKLLPHYPVPENRSAGEYLQELCQKQLGKRVEKILRLTKALRL